MKKIQSLISLKIISYILIPILTLNILVNAFSIAFYESSEDEIHENMTYFETEQFVDNFLMNIYGAIKTYIKTNNDNIVITDVQNNSIIETKIEEKKDLNYQTSCYNDDIYEYLVIDENGIAYTNVEKTVRNRYGRKDKNLY